MIKKVTNQLVLGFILLVFFSLKLSPIKAQDEVPDSIVGERLQYIKTTLDRDRAKTKVWWYGWLAGYSSLTIVQGVIYLNSNDKNTRQDMALGAATNILGAAGQFITPLIPGDEPKKLFSLPEDTKDQRLKKMEYAEQLLNDVAKREKQARSWKNHAITGAINLSSGLITWLGFKRTFWDGVENFAINSVVTEAQIWTQPTLAKRQYENYCRDYLQSDSGTAYIPRVSWYITAHPGGVGIKAVF